MPENEALKALREQIDVIDNQMIPLFQKRMEVANAVAEIKRQNNIPILDEGREKALLQRLMEKTAEEHRASTSMLYRTILALSRSQQRIALALPGITALPKPRAPRRENIVCTFQGVPGAWSEHALVQVLPEAERQSAEYFEDVFLAVRDGRSEYGVVALENSQTGAIGETYDLLRRYSCYIVGRTVVEIRHCLLAPEGTRESDIRTVYSHPEGFKQCARYLQGRGWEQSGCRNTAVAARKVREAGDGASAAIGSRMAGELNGLAVIAPDIMDTRNNKTTFVVIAKEPEYDASSNLVAVTFSTLHRSGALCESLIPFLAQDINLTRIESRPEAAGNYRFFVEMEGNVEDPAVQSALRQSAEASEYFEVIGCYKNY